MFWKFIKTQSNVSFQPFLKNQLIMGRRISLGLAIFLSKNREIGIPSFSID